MSTIIARSIDDRPIYYAASARHLADALGVSDHLVLDGLALRLESGVATPRSRTVQVHDSTLTQLAQLIDVDRTNTLAANVFVHRGGFPHEWTYWKDGATENIPYFYGVMHAALAQAFAKLDETAEAARHAALRDAFMSLALARWNEVNARR
jgi:hypothetical protein